MPDLEKNKQLARDFFEQIWNKGNESVVHKLINNFGYLPNLK